MNILSECTHLYNIDVIHAQMFQTLIETASSFFFGEIKHIFVIQFVSPHLCRNVIRITGNTFQGLQWKTFEILNKKKRNKYFY